MSQPKKSSISGVDDTARLFEGVCGVFRDRTILQLRKEARERRGECVMLTEDDKMTMGECELRLRHPPAPPTTERLAEIHGRLCLQLREMCTMEWLVRPHRPTETFISWIMDDFRCDLVHLLNCDTNDATVQTICCIIAMRWKDFTDGYTMNVFEGGEAGDDYYNSYISLCGDLMCRAFNHMIDIDAEQGIYPELPSSSDDE